MKNGKKKHKTQKYFFTYIMLVCSYISLLMRYALCFIAKDFQNININIIEILPPGTDASIVFSISPYPFRGDPLILHVEMASI